MKHQKKIWILASVIIFSCFISCNRKTQDSKLTETELPKEELVSNPSVIQKEVCFTIDDLPVVSYGISDNDYLRDITQKLISKFDAYKIPAIGFVNERKIYRNGKVDSLQLSLLKLWYQNGYEIGNHTYSHISYHKSSFEDFTADVLKGEKISRQLGKEFNSELKYFRHPFLHAGNSKEKYDLLNTFLKEKGYIVAPISIDNGDYLFASAYAKAEKKKDSKAMSLIGDTYIKYMEEKIIFFEEQSDKLFGRNIKHTLLIHASKLNAEYLDELAQMYLDNGYTFISLSKALEDKAYTTEITKFGNYGISWIDRWALSQGKKGDFFANDPEVPEWVSNYEK